MDKANEYYVDGIRVAPNHFGVKLVLQRSGLPVATTQTDGSSQRQVMQSPYEDVAVVNMSHEHAKLLVIVLWRTLKDYEQQEGYKIPMAKSILELQKIDLEKEW